MTKKQITFSGLIIIPILTLGWGIFSFYLQKPPIQQEGDINTVGQVGNNTVNNNYPATTIVSITPTLLNSKSGNFYMQKYEITFAYPSEKAIDVVSTNPKVHISNIESKIVGSGMRLSTTNTFPYRTLEISFITDNEVNSDDLKFSLK